MTSTNYFILNKKFKIILINKCPTAKKDCLLGALRILERVLIIRLINYNIKC